VNKELPKKSSCIFSKDPEDHSE